MYNMKFFIFKHFKQLSQIDCFSSNSQACIKESPKTLNTSNCSPVKFYWFLSYLSLFYSMTFGINFGKAVWTGIAKAWTKIKLEINCFNFGQTMSVIT